MDEERKGSQEGNSPLRDPKLANINENSQDESPTLTFEELIKERSFLGKVPPDEIFESIEKQFQDYINLEDDDNYVDIFYTQLHLSYDRLNYDDSEEHPNEIREVLDGIYQKFVDLMRSLFLNRLTISIPDIEAGNVDMDDAEYILRRLYEFFILGAKNNFKTIIATDIRSKNPDLDQLPDEEYFTKIQVLMNDYSPLITTITPTDFLKYRGDIEIQDLYDNGRIAGNFLRKYTPKLYLNEEFAAEVINRITAIQQFRNDAIDSDETSIIENITKEDNDNG